jgi:hypothetical protein
VRRFTLFLLLLLAACTTEVVPGIGDAERPPPSRPLAPLQVTVESPARDAWTSDAEVVVRGRVEGLASGARATVRVGSSERAPVGADGHFEARVRLDDGVHELDVVAQAPGAEGKATAVVRIDRTPPRFLITWPYDGQHTGADAVWVRGRVQDGSGPVDLVIETAAGKRALKVERGQVLSERVDLPLGATRLTLVATDSLGHEARLTRTVTREEGFFGLPITAGRVVFVIDTSGSMILLDRPPSHPTTEVDLSKAAPDDPAVRELQRLARAKSELAAAIAGLRPDQQFNVIAYSSDVRRWRSGVVAADEDAKASALRFVGELAASGLTRTRDALEAALEDPDVEAIYLLSDGAPADRAGANLDELRALAREGIAACMALARERAVERRVRIHVLGMDGPGVHLARWGQRDTPDDPAYLAMLRRFLEELAHLTGGTFKSI